MVNYDTVLIRYGELSTKGKNRKDFIRRLGKNIQYALNDFPKLEYKNTYDRIYIKLNGENAEQIEENLKHIFGISSFSFTQLVKADLDVIVDEAFKIAQDYPTGTFKVVARRHDKTFPYISDQINRAVASKILQNLDHQVDVHQPDFKIFVEVREKGAYLMSKIIKGAGGYPVGVNGKALLLLSGGIDSPVAAYEIMKRGVKVEAIHYASPPYTSTSAQQKVLDLAALVARYQGSMKVHIVPFTDLQLEIYKNTSESYAITVMRRMMYRIAERVAESAGCLVLATGESIGQVASQTLESMACINEVIKMPVIRPVATFDKLEIIDLARKINTYETSILPFEDCCTIFDPKNPVTRPKIKKAQEFEAKFDYEKLIAECIEKTTGQMVFYKTKAEEDFL